MGQTAGGQDNNPGAKLLKGTMTGIKSYEDENAALRQPRGGGGMDMGMNAGGPPVQPFLDQSQNALNQATARKPNPYFYGFGQ